MGTTSTTDDVARHLADAEVIRQIEIRYVEAQDDAEWDALADLLDDEIELSMGGHKQRVSREQYAQMTSGGFAAISPHESRHVIVNQRSTIDGDNATSRATSMAMIRGRVDGEDVAGTLVARFSKSLRRQGDTWVITNVTMLDVWPSDAGGARLLGALMGG